MESVWVIIGTGPNGFELPCLIFKTEEEALDYLEKHTIKNHKYKWFYPVDNTFKAFYTSYYDGCGECYTFYIEEVKFGKPFVHWNLD